MTHPVNNYTINVLVNKSNINDILVRPAPAHFAHVTLKAPDGSVIKSPLESNPIGDYVLMNIKELLDNGFTLEELHHGPINLYISLREDGTIVFDMVD